MDLNSIWFGLIAVLFIGYFFLEGFDFGVGMLMPFIADDELERRLIINSIGPFWDANEVWLITAGGTMFAAFPHWYATMFSGFYLPFFIILIALILRAVGFEFRGKVSAQWWRAWADRFIFIGSAAPAFLWGVTISNFVRGVPIGEDMNFTGTFLSLLSPFALLGGLVSLSVFALHGALFVSLRTQAPLQDRALTYARRLWLPTACILLGFFILSHMQTSLFTTSGLVPGTLPSLAMMSFIAAFIFIRLRLATWAFAMTGLTIITATIVAFNGLYPRVMPSSLSSTFDLTIYNASSSPLTLKILLIVMLCFLPIVFLYQGYSYWVFRRRLTPSDIT